MMLSSLPIPSLAVSFCPPSLVFPPSLHSPGLDHPAFPSSPSFPGPPSSSSNPGTHPSTGPFGPSRLGAAQLVAASPLRPGPCSGLKWMAAQKSRLLLSSCACTWPLALTQLISQRRWIDFFPGGVVVIHSIHQPGCQSNAASACVYTLMGQPSLFIRSLSSHFL